VAGREVDRELLGLDRCGGRIVVVFVFGLLLVFVLLLLQFLFVVLVLLVLVLLFVLLLVLFPFLELVFLFELRDQCFPLPNVLRVAGKLGRNEIDGPTLEMSNSYRGETYHVHPAQGTTLVKAQDPDHSGWGVDSQVANNCGGFVSNYVLTRQGQLPHFKLGPRDLRFRRSRLMAWMEEQENAA